MYQTINCRYGDENKLKRKELKKLGYISSVGIAKKLHKEIKIKISNEYFFRKMQNLVKKVDSDYVAIYLNIDGTGKWWYKESQLMDMVKEITRGK